MAKASVNWYIIAKKKKRYRNNIQYRFFFVCG